MARIRSVKPEICESETMARLSAEVERTFVRLWTHLDDHGRAKDHPGLIKAALFPLHDDVTPDVVDEHLWKLADEGLVVRYEVDGKRWLASPSWAEHQHPQKPRPSKIPAPDDASRVRLRDGDGTPPVAVPEQSGPVVVVGVVGGEVEVGEAVEVAIPVTSENHSDTPLTDRSTDGDEGDRVVAHVPPVTEQEIRRTAALVGHSVAAGRSDVADPGAYAATVTTGILKAADQLDRERIARLLGEGQTPEQVASGWLTFDGLATANPAIGAGVVDAEAVREAARRTEEATAAKLAEIAAVERDDDAGIARVRALRGRAS